MDPFRDYISDSSDKFCTTVSLHITNGRIHKNFIHSFICP